MSAAKPLPQETDVPLSAQSMIDMLRRHYLPDDTRPAGIFAPDIQAPGRTRCADLIWLGCTAATGNHLIGHEIKVSRADLLVELADLTKSDPWQQYCDRWWLVIPPSASLIQGLDLPESWGVLTPPSGRRTRSMTVHHPAPLLRPAEQTPALRTLAVWLHWRLKGSQVTAADYELRYTQALHEIQQLRLTAQPERPDGTRDVVTRIIRELGGRRAGSLDEIGNWHQHVQVDDVVAALQDLGAVYERRDQALRVLKTAEAQLENAQRSITRALGEIRTANTSTNR